ncbi:zinc ribbon domain-containing protein [Erythrobacter sp. THAF29]|uniref:zinc ribbon domain-containing protein n=1 Tax=Erythrobacter sp. THAF29 TaxID=2587851 RepID=UPI001269039F|nr:hypothetical protein [Erythrobacter sp. THAF29]
MESQPLVLTDPNMLAEFVRQKQLKAFFEKRFAAPADLGAILFRDGAVIDGFKGTQFSVGGFWENVKGLIGGSHHYEILLVDLKPFQAVIPVRAMSKDHVEIVGEATFELQINPDKPTNALGLMRGVSRNESEPDDADKRASSGRKALTVPDVITRLEPQFRERIFGAILGRHNADEIRGNRGLQDQIQADMMKEAERILGDLGVLVRNATTNWAANEVERQEFERARIARAEEMKDYQLELLKRQVSREADSTAFMLNTTRDQTKLQQANADELRHMVLDSEVEFIDAREAHARRQEFEALEHEARIIVAENEAKTQIALGEISDETAKAEAKMALTRAQQDLQVLDGDFRIKRAEIDADFRRREELKGAKHGAAIADINRGTRREDGDLDKKDASDWNKIAAENLERLNEIELAKAKGESSIRIQEEEAAAKSEIDKMLAAGRLTPEQLSQYMPGVSESAAQVAIARAQAESRNADEMIRMVREITAEGREHEHRMVGTGMQGGVGMAAGLGGKGNAGGTGSSATTVECPNCKTVNSAKAKFCKSCGQQLRN